MYLQVARLSEITSADGRTLRDDILKGRESLIFESSTLWPRQGRPPKVWWNLWKNKLKLVFSVDGVAPTLRDKLGYWNAHMRPSEWTTLASTRLCNTEVYIREHDGTYRVYRGRSSTTHKSCVSLSEHEIVDLIPEGAVPASLGNRRKDGTCRVYFRGFALSLEIVDSDPKSFAEYVARQHSHIRKLLEHSDLSDDTATAVSRAISTNSNFYCGTDGGLLRLVPLE